MFDRILVPTDGSKPATRAAKYGLELAAIDDATVEILHVLKEDVLSDAALQHEKKERWGTILEEAADLDVAGSPAVETRVVVGTPGDAITSHVADHDVDLVVMGRHGRSNVGEYLFGTVAERVLRGVEVPVMTVTGGTVRTDTGRTYDDILVTTDGSDVAERAGPYGGDLARLTGAAVHVLSVVDVQAAAGPFDAGGVSTAYVERLEDEHRGALDRLAGGLGAGDVDTRTSLRRGTPAAEIAAYARENGIDLVVMASQGQTNLLGQHLGSTTRRVLRILERPVLVVPVPE